MASAPSGNQEGNCPAALAGPGGIVLPGFMELLADGVYVDTASLPSAEEFQRAVDRVFSSGCFFNGLDYAVFQRLLYDFDVVASADRLRLAGGIQEFPSARRALYRGVKTVGGEAAYIFEPVVLESTVDEPVYAAGEDREMKVIGSERKVLTEAASLDPDEFVADLWAKGVRFGIDIAAVRKAIEEGRCERVVVARDRPAAAGLDAGIEEQTPELHRDNAPRQLLNGRVDLGQFQNRFPQIRKGTLLIKKTPKELGRQGRTVAGHIMVAPLPKDFDLASLAGEGTRIENMDGCDYIVAAMDGFLNLDTKTNRISITEKIVNRDGVSARTTGNLVLSGDQFEEFGEVQEGRVVEGKSLTFHSDVYGKVLSGGGDILLMRNLVGGTALNRAGTITVSGLASNAHVQTGTGTIAIKRAENCVLVGDRVELEWACNCTVLADEVEIQVSEGCTVAGKRIHLGTGTDRSGQDTLVSVLFPDFSGLEGARKKQEDYLVECEELMAGLKNGIDRLMEEPDLRNYFAIAGKIHRKEITLSQEQQGQWQQMGARLAPSLKRIGQAREDIKSLEAEVVAVRERIANIDAEKGKASAELSCAVDSIQGDVTVRTLVLPLDSPSLARLPPRELKLQLRAPDASSQRLFSGSMGEFSWKPE